MTDVLTTAERLYAALADGDPTGLSAVLDPGFRGVVAEGMPLGVGGVHDGAAAMLHRVWGPTDVAFDVTPVPAEYLPVGDGRVVVTGHYRGVARATGQPVDAAFVHLLRITRDRITELVQVTDTHRWHAALAG